MSLFNCSFLTCFNCSIRYLVVQHVGIMCAMNNNFVLTRTLYKFPQCSDFLFVSSIYYLLVTLFIIYYYPYCCWCSAATVVLASV